MGKIDIHCLIGILENNSASDLKISLAQFIRKNKPKINFSQLATETMVLENLDENSFFIFITEGKIKNLLDFQNLLWHLPSKIFIALLPEHNWGFSYEQEEFAQEILEMGDFLDFSLIYNEEDWENFLKNIEDKIESHINNSAGRNSALTKISRKGYQGLGIETIISLKKQDRQNKEEIFDLEASFTKQNKYKFFKNSVIKKENKLKLRKKKPLRKEENFYSLLNFDNPKRISLKKRRKSLIKKRVWTKDIKDDIYKLDLVSSKEIYTQTAPELNIGSLLKGFFCAVILLFFIAINPPKAFTLIGICFLVSFALKKR